MKQRQRTIIDDLAEAVAVECDFMRESLHNHLIKCAQNEDHRAIKAITSRGQTYQEFIIDGKEDRYVYCYLFVDLYGINVNLKNDLQITATNAMRTITLDYTNRCAEGIYHAKILAKEKKWYRLHARVSCYLFCKEHGIGYTNETSGIPMYFEAADCTVYLVLANTLRDAKSMLYSYLKPVQ
jgi:hypothetical protein